MKPHEKMLLELKMLDEGIIPNTDHWSNVAHHFDAMDSKEARRVKRKWRKLKRKALLNHPHGRRQFRPQEKFAVIMMLARDHNT
jgi:hypothetical protein|tara:strand:- start:35 stop:286 length:252 start_codon:yes stop_codon:yes gene_type:complete